jgi:hypothetical protein
MEIDWKKFREFLELRSSNKVHINNIINFAKKHYSLLFSSPLDFALEIKKYKDKKTYKRHLLQALAALAKFLDLQNNTEYYYKNFSELRKKAGISWYEPKLPAIIVNSLDKNKIVETLKYMPKRLKATCILHLLTGLRTHELFYLIKNFDNLRKKEYKDGYLVEMLFIRKTKKSFFCILHKNAIKYVKIAYRCKRSYWKNIRRFGIKAYDFRRIFESIYDNLRTHEIELLQGRIKEEIVSSYTRDIDNIVEKVLKRQEEILSKIPY